MLQSPDFNACNNDKINLFVCTLTTQWIEHIKSPFLELDVQEE